MKTNFEKFAWVVAVGLLLSGISQSAWAETCTRDFKIRNTIPDYAVDNIRVYHKWDGQDWKQVGNSGLKHQSQLYEKDDWRDSRDNCGNLKWRVKIEFRCVDKGSSSSAYKTFSGKSDPVVYANLKKCDGTTTFQLGEAPVWTPSVSGNALTCSPEPQVTLYPRPDKTGGPVIFKNIAMSSLNDAADDNGSSLNDWTGSLEVISGTWRFFKHDNYEGKQMYVAAPHTIKKMSVGYSTWAANSSGLDNTLSSMKPVSCDSKPLGSRQNKGYMGYLYGYQDNACLQKKEVDFKSGIDIHYWDQCNGHTQQNRAWYWDPVSGYIHNLDNPEYCIHKTSSGFNAGDNIHLWRCDDGSPENKEWIYNPSTHQITSRGNSGFCIDHSGTHNGAKIHLWSCSPNDGNSNNQWKITWGPNGN